MDVKPNISLPTPKQTDGKIMKKALKTNDFNVRSTVSLLTLALASVYPVYAQNTQNQSGSEHAPGNLDFQPANSSRFNSVLGEQAARDNANPPIGYDGIKQSQPGSPNYSVNAKVGEVQVEVERNGIPADGISATGVTVRLFDMNGQPIKDTTYVSIEASGGRIQILGAQTDELGPGRLDIDRNVPGTQLKVENGVAKFNLLSPATAQDVRLRVTAGKAQAAGTVSYLPALREMLAVGMVEGIIRLKKNDGVTLSPVRLDDGFEQELHRFERSFRNGTGTAAARAAFFLKGKIPGDALLTASYDTDKETRARLLSDIKPEDFYPVYGDASLKGVETKSSTKLYVRVDKDRSYILYGDFSTGAGFSQMTGSGSTASFKLRNLGQYSRTLTGVRGHYENSAVSVNTFAARDSLKQVVEEFLANGTSGPFAIKNTTALEGSEKIEIVIRDKNQPAKILDIQPQAKLVDYVFEPFSGRILFKGPVSSLDVNGNPQSIRVTYEVDQGGKEFWLYGVDGQVKIGKDAEIGGSYVQDKNPNAPMRIASANAGVKIGENATIVAEIAQTHTRRYATPASSVYGAATYALPTGAVGEEAVDLSGKAYRIEGQYVTKTTDARAYFARSDIGFDNPAASYTGGRGEMGVRVRSQVTNVVSVFANAIKSEDRATGAKRTGADLGLGVKVGSALTIDFGVRKAKEEGGSNPAPILSNSSMLGGGFFGQGTANVNAATGTTILAANAPLSVAGGAASVDTTTMRIGASLKISDNSTGNAEYEKSFSGDKRQRIAVGLQYRIDERTKLYGRYETQSGLSTVYSGDKTNAFVFGADTTWMPGMQTFSEYRLRDASSQRDLEWSNGMRNSWEIAQGLRLTNNVEYLKILSGSTRDALAMSFGLDYTANERWKGSTKLEWRRLFDDKATIGRDAVDTWLSTVSIANKLSRDYTFLGRNYLQLIKNTEDSAGTAKGNVLNDRFQLGVAYRPVDSNSFNALARYEYKLEKDLSITPINDRRVHMFSMHAVSHPSRAFWFSGRLAAKSVHETLDGQAVPRYTAALVSARAVYDVTENWDIGLMGSMMYSPQGGSRQYALGLEIGYLVAQNLWMSAGYNFTGFTDKDLTGTDYTNKGVYVRMRYKFDEDLFSGKDTDTNRTLNRN